MRFYFFVYLSVLGFLSFSMVYPNQLFAQQLPFFNSENPKKYLKQRQPTWYPKVNAYFDDGSTKEVLFYEPKDKHSFLPVKRLAYYENQQIALEEDLVWDAECQEAKPNGMSVNFWDSGSVQSFVFFNKGLKQGQTKHFYKNGKLKLEAGYKDNELDGAYASYHFNGQLQESIKYQNGKREGKYIFFDEKGNKLKEATYLNGLMEGSFFSWYPGGNLESTLLFKQGLLHSNESSPACVKYRETGVIAEVQNYSNGQREGLFSEYYPSSQLSYRVLYRKGLKEGKEEYFSEDGRLLGGGEYKAGKPVKNHIIKYPSGLFKCIAIYDAQGNLLKPIEMFYPNGQKESVYSVDSQGRYDKEACTWHPNGQLASKAFYLHGNLEGKQIEYDENGQLKHEATFTNGVMTHLKKWHPNGQLALESEKNMKGEDEGSFRSWYEEGQKEIECAYQEGEFNGSFNQWFSNGQQKIQSHYLMGQLQGSYKEWYPSGQLKKEAFYEDDKLHNVLKLWYENGHLQLEAFYEEGTKEGLEQTFFSSGQVRSKCFFKSGQINGLCQSWFESGQLHLSMEYDHGVPHGLYQEYYPSEQKDAFQSKQILNYHQGRLDGEQKSFYPNGQLEALLTYQEGELHGKKAKWSREGELLHESFYDKGQLNGRYYEMHSDHSEVIYHYLQNKKHGEHFIYYPQDPVLGSVKALVANYENDLLEGEVSEFHEGGEKVASTFYHEGKKHGISKVYTLKGTVIAVAEYEDGMPHGQSIQYYPEGEIYKQTYFEKGKKNGRETTYFPNGEILSEYQYSHGKLNGHCFEKNSRGYLIFEAEYKEGLRHGIFNKYDDDGRPKV